MVVASIKKHQNRERERGQRGEERRGDSKERRDRYKREETMTRNRKSGSIELNKFKILKVYK